MVFHHKCIAALGVAMFAATLVAGSNSAFAGEADVLAANAVREEGGTYRFDVTVRHDDTGWEHYADRFEVLAPDGTVLGTRILHHPHVEEQPFTRSLTRVMVPADLKQVRIRAGDSVHGTGGAEVTIQLPSH